MDTSRARISWARGFFRLWLIVSALWVAGTVALGFISAPSYSSTSVYVGGPDSIVGEQLSVYGPVQWQTGADILYAYLPELAGAMRAAEIAGDVAALATLREAHSLGEAELRANRLSQVFGFTLLSLLPPTIILLLGAGLGWALRGFRKPQP